jgi:hypothetical protein
MKRMLVAVGVVGFVCAATPAVQAQEAKPATWMALTTSRMGSRMLTDGKERVTIADKRRYVDKAGNYVWEPSN